MKVVLQSPQVLASGNSKLLLAPVSVNANKANQTILPETPVQGTNKQKKSKFLTPDSFPNWLIYGLSALLVFLIGGSLICAREGRNALAKAQMEINNIPTELKSTVLESMDGIFETQSTGIYINAGLRSMFNKLVEKVVIKNREYLYKKHKTNM